ncbi:DUF4411 family protein [Paludibacter jiangxiensis]|uniref:PIN domain-containing protein n=1 Tax=Paludibacter jiangxiensis TaxID=681398 RepID=A0A170YQ67_9BACT|nr:DUF4411 family protein [Paludibacter jiangxiensis]GAT61972.1 hypothetical protein PJIAN_1561 [Paludibacter jiangxiensis]
MKVYVLDSNFFIQAHRAYYPLDIAVGFWLKVKQLAHEGKIISIDKVKNELYDKNDELELWCKENLPENFFQETDDIMPAYSRLILWTNTQRSHFLPKAIDEFLDADEADAFLVAYALTDNQNRVIVTQEVSEPTRKNKIKIPQPANVFHIRYVNAMTMFRELGESF